MLEDCLVALIDGDGELAGLAMEVLEGDVAGVAGAAAGGWEFWTRSRRRP